ncbi:hypothetical protein MPTK1_5g19110 [Marchantia polymorpha subsp. ruderalis]|uniref:Uncharacterized protein n=2 Tax=Marchantia polymorpha TaxID=3197 RepID=A0AAF6BJY5_MARPO|nr:hypothetical protein MARPO_0073s0032 [Marchantia polymorpha]BBN12319.1 hypothetical protein Mp_5g19110 [Marchantia polymorpha subsp. ruderalis]|eukprot:PTQ35158.1 hypothetical protein MARPO_0073s0032 [Marchantia polymorpha]
MSMQWEAWTQKSIVGPSVVVDHRRPIGSIGHIASSGIEGGSQEFYGRDHSCRLHVFGDSQKYSSYKWCASIR